MTSNSDISENIEDLLQQHYLSNSLFNDSLMAEMADRFQAESYIKLTNFVPPSIQNTVRAEVYHLLDRYSLRKQIFVKATGNTPRFMETVRQSDIAAGGQIIPWLYHSEVFINFISQIVGEQAIVCPYEDEKFLISRMTEPGDTHGWHWDDYSYNLVWLIECPPPELGGTLEFIPNTIWDKDHPNVDYYLATRTVQRRNHATGDAYLLKANTSMHHVTPLKANTVRIMLVLTWAGKEDLAKNITHETMEEVYVT
jgi:hypothetical protein